MIGDELRDMHHDVAGDQEGGDVKVQRSAQRELQSMDKRTIVEDSFSLIAPVMSSSKPQPRRQSTSGVVSFAIPIPGPA